MDFSESFSSESDKGIIYSGDETIFLKSHHWANKTESDLSMYQASESSVIMDQKFLEQIEDITLNTSRNEDDENDRKCENSDCKVE